MISGRRVLHLFCAVQPEAARNVAQEAGDAEAHIRGIARRGEDERREADDHTRADD